MNEAMGFILIGIIVVIVVFVLWVILSCPTWIAQSRGVDPNTVKLIRLLSLVGLFVGITWLIALIWAIVATPKGKTSQVQLNAGVSLGFPEKETPPEVNGTYKVNGIDKATNMDVTEYIKADSAANAKVKAELAGTVVTKVTLETESKVQGKRGYY